MSKLLSLKLTTIPLKIGPNPPKKFKITVPTHQFFGANMGKVFNCREVKHGKILNK